MYHPMYKCAHTPRCQALMPPHTVPGPMALWGGTARDEKMNTERVDANLPGEAERLHVCQPLHTNMCTQILRLSTRDTCAPEVLADRLAHGCVMYTL